MLQVFFWFFVLFISLVVLAKAADYFTDSAEKIGVFFHLPVFIIGVTIVSIGTTLPELSSSVMAIWEGYPEIVFGNVVGSNITNIFLILGLVGILKKKLVFNYKIIDVDLPLLLGSAFLTSFFLWDGKITKIEALFLLVGFGVFIFHLLKTKKRFRKQEREEISQEIKKELRIKKSFLKGKFPFKSFLILIFCFPFIFISAKIAIFSVLKISQFLEIKKEAISATFVALGTSLPEILVAISIIKKKDAEMVVGNILGANLLNTFWVLGITGLLGEIFVKVDYFLFENILIMLVATFMYVFITQDQKITREEGGFLLILYLFYLGRILEFF